MPKIRSFEPTQLDQKLVSFIFVAADLRVILHKNVLSEHAILLPRKDVSKNAPKQSSAIRHGSGSIVFNHFLFCFCPIGPIPGINSNSSP